MSTKLKLHYLLNTTKNMLHKNVSPRPNRKHTPQKRISWTQQETYSTKTYLLDTTGNILHRKVYPGHNRKHTPHKTVCPGHNKKHTPHENVSPGHNRKHTPQKHISWTQQKHAPQKHISCTQQKLSTKMCLLRLIGMMRVWSAVKSLCLLICTTENILKQQISPINQICNSSICTVIGVIHCFGG